MNRTYVYPVSGLLAILALSTVLVDGTHTAAIAGSLIAMTIALAIWRRWKPDLVTALLGGLFLSRPVFSTAGVSPRGSYIFVLLMSILGIYAVAKVTVERRAGIVLLGAVVLLGLLNAVVDAASPDRLGAELVLLLSLWVGYWVGMLGTTSSRRLTMMRVYAIVALEAVLVIIFAPTVLHPDFLKGTLVGHEAGSHVLGGVFAILCITTAHLGFERHMSRRSALALTALFGLALLLVDARQVSIALIVSIIVYSLTRLTVIDRISTRPIRVIMMILGLAVAILGAKSLFHQGVSRVEAITYSGRDPIGLYAIEAVCDTGVWPCLMGVGAGNGTSRIGLIASAEAYGISSARKADTLGELAFLTSDVRYGGTFERAASSFTGLATEFGLVGLLLYTGALGLLMYPRGARLGPDLALWAGLCSQVLLLALVSHWLEYPEYTLVLGMTLGALRQSRTAEYAVR